MLDTQIEMLKRQLDIHFWSSELMKYTSGTDS